MKKIVFLLMQIYVLNFVIAQNYINNKYIFGNDFAAGGFQGILQKNDTLIMAGIVVEWENVNQRKGFFTKMDNEGNVINFKLVDTSNVNYFWILPRSICKLHEKGYLCTGTYDNAEYMNCFLAKVDENLDTVWVKKLHHSDPVKQLLGRSIFELPNGNIYLFCEVWKYQSGVGVVDNNTLLILLDAQGNEISRREWGVGYTKELPKGLLVAPWGLLAYGGNAFLTANINNVGGYILGLDTLCNVENVYICPKADSVIWINSLELTSDTNLIACGIMTRQNPTTQDWSCLGYIAKYSPPPYQQLWQIRFQLANCEYSELFKVVATPDAGAVVCGDDPTNPNGKGWLLKVNKDGQIVWDRRHTLITGGDHYFSDMVRNTDGGFSLVGYIYSHNSDPIGTYAWLARTDSFGCLVPGCQTVGIAAGENVSYKMLISPNPTADFLNVYIAQKPDFEGFLRLYDTNGKVVLSGAVSGQDKTYIFPVRGLPSGVYYLEMSAQGRILHTEKVVKE